MGSIGMPELIILLVILVLCVGLPWFFYRLGYNRGYAKGLEKVLEQRR
jgi:hypothetical protein